MVMHRAIASLFLPAALAVAAYGESVPVGTTAELIDAIDNAARGDVITLAPGTYTVNQNLICDASGSAAEPIIVRAEQLGDASIRFNATEGFKVSGAHWLFENLDIEGICSSHSSCEHAFHLFGDADFVHIRANRMHEYNAMIKSNITNGDFPDDVVVEFNEFFNSSVRNTSNPVTPIDIVGGRRWKVRANLIADFAKGQGNGISYAAFLKGNSKDGLFERNLVICELHHTGGTRVGLSFGGGGSDPDSICEEGTCTPEHAGGIMRNNVILNCPDVGIYLNEAADVQIHNNTIFDTSGIDVRFDASIADLRNNLLSGVIRERDGGTATVGSNLQNVSTAEFTAWFTNPAGADFSLLDGSSLIDLGETLVAVPTDYCANNRDDGATDIGAVEYDSDGACDTTIAGGVGTAGDAPCSFPVELELTDLEITETETYEACARISVGPNVGISGEATFQAPVVIFHNDVSVESGGRLTVLGTALRAQSSQSNRNG